MARRRTARPPGRRRSHSRLGTYANEVPVASVGLKPTGRATASWVKMPAVPLLLGSLTLIYGLFSNAKFLVAHVAVQGTALVPAAEIERVADLDFRNIFQINTDDLAARLQREFGCIADASVVCRLPNRVTITIREHDALAVWESLGAMWWVDAQGRVLGRAHDPGDTPVIHDRQGLVPDPEDYVVGVPWDLLAGLVRTLPEAKSIDYLPGHGLVLHVTAEDWPVYLGHGGNAATKVALMQELVDRLARERVNVAHIDLQDEQRPSFKAP